MDLLPISNFKFLSSSFFDDPDKRLIVSISALSIDLLYSFLFTKQNNKLIRKLLHVFLLTSTMNLLKESITLLFFVIINS